MGSYTHVEVGVTAAGCRPRCELCEDYHDDAVQVLVVTPNKVAITITVNPDGSGEVDLSGSHTIRFL